MDAEVSFLDPSVGWKCAVGCGSFVPFSLPRASAGAVVTAPESFVPLPKFDARAKLELVSLGLRL